MSGWLLGATLVGSLVLWLGVPLLVKQGPHEKVHLTITIAHDAHLPAGPQLVPLRPSGRQKPAGKSGSLASALAHCQGYGNAGGAARGQSRRSTIERYAARQRPGRRLQEENMTEQVFDDCSTTEVWAALFLGAVAGFAACLTLLAWLQ